MGSGARGCAPGERGWARAPKRLPRRQAAPSRPGARLGALAGARLKCKPVRRSLGSHSQGGRQVTPKHTQSVAAILDTLSPGMEVYCFQ
ncbi:hypothetical protein HispidOSU_025207 [Sigmodon hispidus]